MVHQGTSKMLSSDCNGLLLIGAVAAKPGGGAEDDAVSASVARKHHDQGGLIRTTDLQPNRVVTLNRIRREPCIPCPRFLDQDKEENNIKSELF